MGSLIVLLFVVLLSGDLYSAPSTASTPTQSAETHRMDVAPDTVLDTTYSITVTARGYHQGSAEIGYKSDSASIGPLGGMKIGDVPFSIQVTSGALIENTSAHDLNSAIKTDGAAGIEQTSDVYSSLSRTIIRGFRAADQNQLEDGLVDRSFTAPPVEGLEEIEILNGPTSFLYGFGALGGTVNCKLKKPLKSDYISGSAGVREGGVVDAAVDVGGPVDSAKRFSYRCNVYKEKGSTIIRDGSQDRSYYAGAFEADLFRGLRLTTGLWHQDYFQQGLQTMFLFDPAHGITPPASKIGPTVQYGQPYTFNKSGKTAARVNIESQLLPNVKLVGSYRYGTMWRSYNAINAKFTDSNGAYQERFRYTPRQYEVTHSYSALSYIDLNTGVVHHDITAGYTGSGYSYKRGPDINYPWVNSSLGDPVRFARPDTSAPETDWYPMSFSDNLLFCDQLSFRNRILLLAGLTWARVGDSKWEDLVTGETSLAKGQASLTPSIGITLKPTSDVSLYGSYIEGLSQGGSWGSNDSAYDPGGNPFPVKNPFQILPASHSSQWETGVKTTVGNIFLTASLFRIDKINEYANPLDSIYEQDGRQVHKGIECSATGKLLKRLAIVASGSLMDAKYVRVQANPALEGSTPANVAQKQASLYAEYRIPVIEGLYACGEARYLGSRPINEPNSYFLPDAQVYSAGLRLQNARIAGKSTTFALNIDNLFNRRYWAFYRAGDGACPGAPRTVAFSTKVIW